MATDTDNLTPAEEKYWNRYRLVQTLQSLAALWAAMAFVAIVMGAAGFLRALSQADWPAAPGVITAVDVENETITSPAARQEMVVRITYGYRVDGEELTGNRVNLNPVPVEVDSEEGRRLLATYPVGTAVAVYYDPDDPASALLEREPSPMGFLAGLTLLGMAAFVGLLALLLGRELKDHPIKS